MIRLLPLLTALISAEVAAHPGDLLEAIQPVLNAPAKAANACLDADGNIYLWGGFSSVNGAETGGILKLGPDGQVLDVLGESLVSPREAQAILLSTIQIPYQSLTQLDDGRFMICEPASGYALVDSGGEISSGFFAGLPGNTYLYPQFEREGFYHFILITAEGSRKLVRQATAADSWQPELLSSASWTSEPMGAIPGPDSSIRVLCSDPQAWSLEARAIRQQVFLINSEGEKIEGSEFEITTDRLATLQSTQHGAYRLILGSNVSAWFLWPSPTTAGHRVEWRDHDNSLLMARDFNMPLGSRFVIAEDASGGLLATGPDGQLRHYLPDGELDPGFNGASGVRSVLPLPDDKWLLNGIRRINADGSPDTDWGPPRLEVPAANTGILHGNSGEVWLAGDFAEAGESGAIGGLAKLSASGELQSDFYLDPRIADIREMHKLADGRILAVTRNHIKLGNGSGQTLVRLLPNGALDETFAPPLQDQLVELPIHTIETIAIQPGGKILVISQNHGSEVSSWQLFRLLDNYTIDPDFVALHGYGASPSAPLVLADGSYFLAADLYAEDGRKIGTVTPPAGYQVHAPLCLMSDGAVVFRVQNVVGSPTHYHLRRLNHGFWDPYFAPPAEAAIGVVPAPDGKLYIWSHAGILKRLHRNGRPDVTFRAPTLELRARRESGPWMTLSNGGLVPGIPVGHPFTPMIWNAACDPASGDLWIAGSFNLVDGQPRDGVAVISGENSSGYDAWVAASLRDRPNHRGPDMDPDGDGISNWLEYATGTDPSRPDARQSQLQAGTTSHSYSVWRNPEAPEVQASIEVSDNLLDWRPGGFEVAMDSAFPKLSFRLHNSLFGRGTKFARVRFHKSAP